MELEIHLSDRKEAVIVMCDRYDFHKDNEWLVLHRDDHEIGRYRRKDVIGFHERPPRAKPVIA